VHGLILTIAADAPLVTSQHTPLEIAHVTFLGNIAHQARYILGVRLLDSGTARDVSGVLRITRGGGGWDDEEEGEFKDRSEDGSELLYYVGGDGGVRVFERGQ
jgi:elongator complex protein 6